LRGICILTETDKLNDLIHLNKMVRPTMRSVT